MRIISKGRVLNSPGFYEKKRRRRRVFFIISVIAILLLVSVVVYFFRQERFLIKEVEVGDENVIDKEEIIEVVKRGLSGNYIWLIPKANAMVYPRSTIKNTLLNNFPRLKTVDLNIVENNKLVVEVNERDPFALYCEDQCYFLDESGFIFALSPSFSEGVYLIFTKDHPIESPIGRELITTQELDSLLKFMKSLAVFKIYPKSLKLGAEDYNLTLSNGGSIIWRKADSLTNVYANLDAFLTSSSVKSQSDFLDKILYLDLRIPNKVFYKFK